MTPGVIRELTVFTGLVLFTGACFYTVWRRRCSARRSLATQRARHHGGL